MAPTGFVARELRHLWPPTLFFLVAFNLMALSVSLSGSGVGVMTYATATVSALICGKAVLIADSLPVFNRYPDRPLIWNVIWKTLLYVTVTLAVRLLEAMVQSWLEGQHLGAGLEDLAAAFSWSHFIMVQMWLAALFLVYTSFGELISVLGRDRLWRLFFGPVGARDA